MNRFKAIGQTPKFVSLRTRNDVAPVVSQGERVVRGISVVTLGEALGHGMWLDSAFLDQVTTAGVALGKGVRSRFTHPGLSSDGLGKYLGRVKDFRREGDQVFGDLHVSPLASKSPDGDLGAYVLELSEKDPEAAGFSIVFELDEDAMDAFEEEHAVKEKGMSRFVSPDAGNVKNYSHARLKALRAVDLVDSPAANPDGMFSTGGEFLEPIEEALAYIFGTSNTCPDETLFGIHPERAKRFVEGFMGRQGLRINHIQEGEPEMQEEDVKAPALAENQEPGGPPVEEKAVTTEVIETAPELAAGAEDPVLAERERCLSIMAEARGVGLEALGEGLVKQGIATALALTQLKALGREKMKAELQAYNPGTNEGTLPVKPSEDAELHEMACKIRDSEGLSYKDSAIKASMILSKKAKA